MVRVAETADQMGLDSLWTMDHFFQIRLTGLPPESPMLEAYATLAFMATRTRRIRLGTLVTSVPYRHPGPASSWSPRSTCSPEAGWCSDWGPGASPARAPDFDPLHPDPSREPPA